MGFDIDEIIGNGEATQKFMRVVLKIVEEQENISLENISPMVKAELLSDHKSISSALRPNFAFLHSSAVSTPSLTSSSRLMK